MGRMIAGGLLVLLSTALAVSSPPANQPQLSRVEWVLQLTSTLTVPGVLLSYFGWYARKAKAAVVRRAHWALPWGLALTALLVLFAVGGLLGNTPNARDALIGVAALEVVALALIWAGLKSGQVEVMTKAAREAAAKANVNFGQSLCAVCESTNHVDVYYYFAPSQVQYFPGANKKRVTYDTDHMHGVSICEACIDRKRSAVWPVYVLGLLVSLPACAIAFGIFGVLTFGKLLWSLRNRNEVGDVLAYHWHTQRKFKLGWLSMEGSITREGFADVKKREGRDAFGRKTAV